MLMPLTLLTVMLFLMLDTPVIPLAILPPLLMAMVLVLATATVLAIVTDSGGDQLMPSQRLKLRQMLMLGMLPTATAFLLLTPAIPTPAMPYLPPMQAMVTDTWLDLAILAIL